MREMIGWNSTLYLPMLRGEECIGVLLVGGVLWSNYARPSPPGEHPEHKIPDYAWPGGGSEDYQHGGPST